MSAPRPAAGGRAAERVLWFAIYLVLVLAPLAFLAAAPPNEDGDEVLAAVAVGFVALTILALQVVVPSRAAAFTAPFGFERLIRFHRAAGLIVVALIAAHVVLVLGADDDFGSWIDPFEAPLAGRLGLAAATLLVVLTFMALWRRVMRIPYESWRGLHVALGLGALALAFGHVIAVSRFSETGTIRWLTLGFVVAAFLAAFYLRVGRQFLAARRPYRLTDARPEVDGSVSLRFEADGHDGAAFAPGQFAWLKRANAPYGLSEHPFSYATSALDPASPGFTIKPAGDFTRAVQDLRPGERMLLDGPHGLPAVIDGRDSVLIAGGSGITPALSVLRTAAAAGDERRFLLLYFNRYEDDFSFGAELAELARELRLEVVTVPSRPSHRWRGYSGRISARLLDELLPADRERWTYFVCGAGPMTDTAVDSLVRLGIPRGTVRAERFQLA